MKQIIIPTVLMMLTVHASVGQTLKTYSGLYKNGKATYTYYEDENGERVKHGKFTYNKVDKGIGVGGGMNISYATTISASGNYKNGVKDGTWTYKNKTAGGGITFADFSAVINYADGRMEGTLNNAGTIFQMRNNRITGQVKKVTKTRNEDWTLTGQFDEEGFPDGTWTKNYKSYGNLYEDTEKYVHGLLVAKQTKNESTGEITRYEFNDVNPQEYLVAYNPDKDSTIVGKLICQEKIYSKQGENNYSYLEDGLMPEIFGVEIRTIVEKIKEESGFGSEQEKYEGIPFKEIVVIGKIEAPNEGEVFDLVEQMPKFPGGDTKLMEYLSTHVQYPEDAQKDGIQGRVFVSFVVNRDGSISDAQVTRSVDPSLDNEALKVINNMPRWIPGQQGGKNVRTRYTLPIAFRLQ